MSDKMRELVRKCNVGKYSFDIVVNREIVRKGFEKHPELLKIAMSSSKYKFKNIDDIDDVETILEILDKNDVVAEEMPKFVADILPDMIEAAKEKVDAKEFLDYCVKNEVDDIVIQELYGFALLGFTEGRSVKVRTPKVKVAFN